MQVKLSIKSYNKLFSCYQEDRCLYVKKSDEDIILLTQETQDEDSEIIANIKINTEEGKVLSYYINCMLKIEMDNDRNISLYECCIGSYGQCDNITFDKRKYCCKIDILKKVKRLKTKIADIKFIDPIDNRNYEIIRKLEHWNEQIKEIKKDFSNNTDVELDKIYNVADLLEQQIKTLLNKWRYDNE